MSEVAPRNERLPSESLFEAARGNLFAAIHVLMQGGTDKELAHAADIVLEYRCLLTDRFTDYSDEQLTCPTEQNIDQWTRHMQYDELLRAQKWEELTGMTIFEMTTAEDWRRQAASYALRGETFDFDLADKLGIDPISYLSEEDESGEWVIDLYDERLVKAIDDLMMFAPPESNEAFLKALERFVRQSPLRLTGDMEIDTAIKVLEAHKPDSAALIEIARVKDLIKEFPVYDDSAPVEIELTEHTNAKLELIEALQLSLLHDEMDELERVWTEGLLAAQQQID